MLGAIAGDVIGSAYEGRPVKRVDFELFPPGAGFTDDTVLTVATAEVISAELQPESFALHPWGLDPGTPCRDDAQARINFVVPAGNAGTQVPRTASSPVIKQALRRS
ncbi:MAG: hypothetical protein WCA32_05565 [Chromatiaceae bacterium]|jgi:hypothetical protein